MDGSFEMGGWKQVNLDNNVLTLTECNQWKSDIWILPGVHCKQHCEQEWRLWKYNIYISIVLAYMNCFTLIHKLYCGPLKWIQNLDISISRVA